MKRSARAACSWPPCKAVSGAGYPGVPSLDILGNVIPYIGDEEPKIEREMQKMLGQFAAGAVTRRAVCGERPRQSRGRRECHTVCLSVEFDRKPEVAEALAAFRTWKGAPECTGLPSAPEEPLHLFDNR